MLNIYNNKVFHYMTGSILFTGGSLLIDNMFHTSIKFENFKKAPIDIKYLLMYWGIGGYLLGYHYALYNTNKNI